MRFEICIINFRRKFEFDDPDNITTVTGALFLIVKFLVIQLLEMFVLSDNFKPAVDERVLRVGSNAFYMGWVTCNAFANCKLEVVGQYFELRNKSYFISYSVWVGSVDGRPLRFIPLVGGKCPRVTWDYFSHLLFFELEKTHWVIRCIFESVIITAREY